MAAATFGIQAGRLPNILIRVVILETEWQHVLAHRFEDKPEKAEGGCQRKLGFGQVINNFVRCVI